MKKTCWYILSLSEIDFLQDIDEVNVSCKESEFYVRCSRCKQGWIWWLTRLSESMFRQQAVRVFIHTVWQGIP